MKKYMAVFLALACLMTASVTAQAKNLYERYWLPGVYVPEITEEDTARYAALWEQVLALSEGTPVRTANEAETLAVQYEKYLQLGEVPERVYDDVGAYTWAVGLPDEGDVSQDRAYAIACMALAQQYDMQSEELRRLWPHFSYVTADPEQPVWQIDFICYDGTQDRMVTVAVYAWDGSVCGVWRGTSVG